MGVGRYRKEELLKAAKASRKSLADARVTSEPVGKVLTHDSGHHIFYVRVLLGPRGIATTRPLEKPR